MRDAGRCVHARTTGSPALRAMAGSNLGRMPARPTTADELRRAFVEFFTERGHAHVPSASVIPVDRTLLFTVAGMVPFKSFFTGEETPPYTRAVSVQKCVRAG